MGLYHVSRVGHGHGPAADAARHLVTAYAECVHAAVMRIRLVMVLRAQACPHSQHAWTHFASTDPAAVATVDAAWSRAARMCVAALVSTHIQPVLRSLLLSLPAAWIELPAVALADGADGSNSAVVAPDSTPATVVPDVLAPHPLTVPAILIKLPLGASLDWRLLKRRAQFACGLGRLKCGVRCAVWRVIDLLMNRNLFGRDGAAIGSIVSAAVWLIVGQW